MTQKERQEIVRKYFGKVTKGMIWAMIIGTIILGAINPVLFIVGLIVSGFIVFKVLKRPSDAEYDKVVSESLANAEKLALQKAGLDESSTVADAVIVTGPRFWHTSGAEEFSRKGDDGFARFTPMDVNVLHMTEHQLVSYQACLDLVTGNYLNEATDEFFYKDVVSIATKTMSETINTEKHGRLQLDSAESFILTTSGGTQIRTILSDPKLIEMMDGGSIPTTDAEKAIQAVRRMLREKKMD